MLCEVRGAVWLWGAEEGGAGKNETIQGSGLECMWGVMVTMFQERSGVLWGWVGNASLLDGGIEIIHSSIDSFNQN